MILKSILQVQVSYINIPGGVQGSAKIQGILTNPAVLMNLQGMRY